MSGPSSLSGEDEDEDDEEITLNEREAVRNLYETAEAINEFLYRLSLGYTPKDAIEFASGKSTYGNNLLRMPSNLQIIVIKE